MRKIFAAFLFTFLFIRANAQWSTDASVNTLVAGVNSSDIQTAIYGNNIWIAFYSLNGSNYDMRVQLMDARTGNKNFGDNGLLISNAPSGSATFVFNVCTDNDGNLIVAFNFMKGSTMHAALQKVSNAGQILWGNGIDLGAGLSPYPVALSNNDIAVAWTNNSVINYQKISAVGVVAWSPVKELKGNPVSKAVSRAQLVAHSNGTFGMVYQQVASFLFYTNLYEQRFDNDGNGIWANPVKISTITTASYRYYDVMNFNDTTYVGYYGNPSGSNRFDAFVQKIPADGSLPWNADGSTFSDYSGNADPYEQTININRHPWDGFIYGVCTFTDPGQIKSGIYFQKFDPNTGEKLLGNNAEELAPITTSLTTIAGSGLRACNEENIFTSTDNTNKLYACAINYDGSFAWGSKFKTICSTTNSKLRYGLVSFFNPILEENSGSIAVWQENRNGDDRPYAQLISCSGALGILPVAITNFSGTKDGNHIKLQWTTASESNNYGFYTEHSVNSKDFSTMGFVASKAAGGNSIQVLSYSFMDTHPAAKNYYRLKQVDKDGKIFYSNIINIETALQHFIKISPNPVQQRLYMQTDFSVDEKISVTITDAMGRIVLQKQHIYADANDVLQFDVSGLIQEMYFLKISEEGNNVLLTTMFMKD